MNVNLTIAGMDFRRKAVRRRIVIVTYLSLLTALICTGAGLSLLAVAAGCAVMFGWWVLNQIAVPYAVNGSGSGAMMANDERQSQVRDRAFFRAYQAVCAMVVFFLIYEVVAVTSPKWKMWLPSTLGDYNSILLTFLIVSITLPHAFLAWQEPDYGGTED